MSKQDKFLILFKELFTEYLDTLDDTEKDDYYSTMWKRESDAYKGFLEWYKAKKKKEEQNERRRERYHKNKKAL